MIRNCLLAVALAGSVVACAPIGPDALRSSRPEYNMAVQKTNDQELLLNLVRLQYRDTLYFTSVERIAATQEMNTSFGGSASVASTHNNPALASPGNTVLGSALTQSLGIAPSIALNEKPTVFYAPVEGEKFVRQMMTPMHPDLLMLLVKSGWSIDRVFSVAVQDMNGLVNAPTASGPTPSREPEFRPFLEAVKLLRQLQRENLLSLTGEAKDGSVHIILHPETASDARALRLKELLGLSPAAMNLRIVAGADKADKAKDKAADPKPAMVAGGAAPTMAAVRAVQAMKKANAKDKAKAAVKARPATMAAAAPGVAPSHVAVADKNRGTTITLTTRPVISALHYLSQGVDVPEADKKAGKVRATITAKGETFDWQELLGDVFHVSAAESAPDNAAVSVKYRGAWFYIADNDLDSKSTFMLLTQLIALHSAPVQGPAISFSFGN